MRKLIIVLAAVSVLVMAAAPAALAAPGKGKPATAGKGQGTKKRYRPFTANGLVTAVVSDDSGTYFQMRVWSGGKMRAERGKVVTINVTDKTRIWRVDGGTRTAIGLADMSPGERVWTAGTFVKTDDGRTYTAKRVKLKASWSFMAKGTVAADGVDTTAGTVTVSITKSMVAMRAYIGTDITFQTSATTRFLKRVDDATIVITLEEIQPGDTVIVNGRVDNTTPDAKVFNARRVLVKG